MAKFEPLISAMMMHEEPPRIITNDARLSAMECQTQRSEPNLTSEPPRQFWPPTPPISEPWFKKRAIAEAQGQGD